MRRLSFCLFIPIFALTALLLFSGCGGGDRSDAKGGDHKRIVILTNGESPFWDAARQGLEAAEKDLKLSGVGLHAELIVNSESTEEGQLERLRQLAGQSDIAALAVSVTKEDN